METTLRLTTAAVVCCATIVAGCQRPSPAPAPAPPPVAESAPAHAPKVVTFVPGQHMYAGDYGQARMGLTTMVEDSGQEHYDLSAGLPGADAQGIECNLFASGNAPVGASVVRLEGASTGGPAVTLRKMRGRDSGWTYQVVPGVLPTNCTMRGTLTPVRE